MSFCGAIAHTLCLEGCHILFGGSSCSGPKQPLHSTKKHSTQTTNTQSCVCVRSPCCVCMWLDCCLPAATATQHQQRANKRSNKNKHVQQHNHTTSKPRKAKHQRARADQRRSVHARPVVGPDGLGPCTGAGSGSGGCIGLAWVGPCVRGGVKAAGPPRPERRPHGASLAGGLRQVRPLL